MLLIWSTVLTTVGSILLALTVLIKAKKTTNNVSFAFLSITIGLIASANFFSLNSKHSTELTLFWIKTVMMIVPFTLIGMYSFCSSYLNPNYEKERKLTLELLALAFIISALNSTPLTYKEVTITLDGKIVPTTGPGMLFNALFIIPVFVLGIYHMVKNAKAASSANRSRIIFTLWFFLTTFGGQIFTSFVLVALFNYTNLVPFGNFLTLIFISAMTLSLLHFNVFGFKVLAPVIFAVVLTLLMFAEIFTATTSQELAYKIVVFSAVSFTNYQLLRNILSEFEQRKEIQKLVLDLRKANDRLKEVDNMKTEFVSMASHELLTPISAIRGYLSMMLDEKLVKIADQRAKKYLKQVALSAKRLAELVAGLLNISRIEEGRLKVEESVVNVADILENVLNELKWSIDESGVEVDNRVKKGHESDVFADPSKIEEVIVNLCSNALKFTPAGGKIIIESKLLPTKEVLSHYRRMMDIKKLVLDKDASDTLESAINEKLKQMVGGNQLVVSVKDTGIGLRKEDIGKLFEKFSRLENWSHHSIPGTGLGLYISRAIIEIHHGRMWAESDGPGKGSSFFFSLPTANVAKEVSELNKEVPEAANTKPLAKVAD